MSYRKVKLKALLKKYLPKSAKFQSEKKPITPTVQDIPASESP